MRLIFILVPFFVVLCSNLTAKSPVRNTSSQEVKFIYPLDLPMSLSGNYGELRGNHFHGGLDFRVGGVSGAPIKAAADGYISKITVTPGGYGNALYITHPNGYVSVYGHLQRYVDKIQKFVREAQYKAESFVVTLELDSLKFPVKQGEKVAYAGNTGSSGGPHLHFEIRDENNLPLNVLAKNFITAKDKLPPVFNSVEFFGYSNMCGIGESFRIQQPANAAIKVPESFYVAIDAVDKMEGTNAKLAVNEYKVFLDDKLVYHLNIGEVPFGEGKYINSLIEYSLKSGRNKSFIKSYLEPANMLDYKVDAVNKGIMVLNDTLLHKVRIEVYDYKMNKAVKTYTVKRDDAAFETQMNTLFDGSYMAWYLTGVYEQDGLKITIPSASLYSSIYFKADTLVERNSPYAPSWKIHSPEVPLHTPAVVHLKYEGPDSLASKALLVAVKKNGQLSGAGGKVVNGELVAKLHSFGIYTIAIDTEAPSIIPNFKDGAVLKRDRIAFTIKDKLSGINNYRVEIDGHWVLAEFDAKNARLAVPLGEAKIKRGTMHKLKISVADNKGNKKVSNYKFKW